MSKRLVLVADDIDDILTLVAFSLEGAGFDVMTACDGDEALELARAHRPDIAIVDVLMPKLDGLTVTRTLKRDPLTREMPVMLLSAHAHEGDVKRGFEAGADDYLRKPFSPVDLLGRVETLLERAQRAA